MVKSSDIPICYLCGSNSCHKIHDAIRYGHSSRPFRCDDCGFTFIHPKMSREEERLFYDKIYRSQYVNESPEFRWMDGLTEARKRVARFQNVLTKNANLLEIGCASGVFLSEVKPFVKSVTGIELTRDYIDYALSKGIDVRESLDGIPRDSLDLVFMFHVLEHIYDPVVFLKNVREKMSPDGLLIIEVPNVDDILVSTYKIKEHLDFYWEVAHNYYFSKETLGKILERAGFQFEIFPLQRYDLSNHMYWMIHRKPGGQNFFKNIFPQSLLDEYENNLKERFLCDTIYTVAKK